MGDKLYFMYKTTNMKNNKFYVGVHETRNLEDGYLGSGKKFKNSLFYHGVANFKREILEYFEDSKSMYNREREIVNEEFLKNPNCLNIGLGGKGGFSKEQRTKGAIEMNKTLWNNPEWVKIKKEEISSRNKELWKNGVFTKEKYSGEKNGFFGKTHSEETKKKMRESAKRRKLKQKTISSK